jgi:hypothetical protein
MKNLTLSDERKAKIQTDPVEMKNPILKASSSELAHGEYIYTRRSSWRKENLRINTDLESPDENEILNQIRDFNIMNEFFCKKYFYNLFQASINKKKENMSDNKDNILPKIPKPELFKKDPKLKNEIIPIKSYTGSSLNGVTRTETIKSNYSQRNYRSRDSNQVLIYETNDMGGDSICCYGNKNSNVCPIF